MLWDISRLPPLPAYTYSRKPYEHCLRCMLAAVHYVVRITSRLMHPECTVQYELQLELC